MIRLFLFDEYLKYIQLNGGLCRRSGSIELCVVVNILSPVFLSFAFVVNRRKIVKIWHERIDPNLLSCTDDQVLVNSWTLLYAICCMATTVMRYIWLFTAKCPDNACPCLTVLLIVRYCCWWWWWWWGRCRNRSMGEGVGEVQWGWSPIWCKNGTIICPLIFKWFGESFPLQYLLI